MTPPPRFLVPFLNELASPCPLALIDDDMTPLSQSHPIPVPFIPHQQPPPSTLTLNPHPYITTPPHTPA